jgi:AcrR family transcriptional regulator
VEKDEILARVSDRLFRFGFSGVTTDDIAKELGISKKTLYSCFPSKKSLLRGVVQNTMDEMSSRLERLFQAKDLNFLDRVKDILQLAATYLSKTSGVFMQDLYRNAHDVWLDVNAFIEEKILGHMEAFLLEGVEKGVVRGDIHRRFIVCLYVFAVQNIINPDQLMKLSLSSIDAFESLVKVVYEGILTEKGRNELLIRGKG